MIFYEAENPDVLSGSVSLTLSFSLKATMENTEALRQIQIGQG